MFRRPSPGEVFTPRSSEVNSKMFVERSELERKLRRAVNGTQNVVVFGDSGNGKTWLYREYFERNSVAYRMVDLSVSITEGLDAALLKSLPSQEWEEVKKMEKQGLSVNAVVAKPAEERVVEYQRRQADALETVLRSLDKEKAKRKFLVFDNFEQVSRDDEIVKSVASLIIRLDNPSFSQFGARLLLVGVVSDMKELIARSDHAGTIANRLTEIPEVASLSPFEAEDLIVRGLDDELRISFDVPLPEVVQKIRFLTDRNAQQIHELCYQIACEAEENGWRLTEEGFKKAENDWVDASLAQYTAQIEERMNKRDTKKQRRNQVLFCLGVSETGSFRATQIDKMVRAHFSDTVEEDGQLGIDQILSSLSAGRNPILIKNPNDNSYRLSNPKLRQALRVRMQEITPKKVQDAEDVLKAILELLEDDRTPDLTDMMGKS